MNLIFIVTDTLRADYLGCYGSEDVRTPRIDELAAQSVRFTEVHGEGLPTIPARRVFLTGRGLLPYDDKPMLEGVDPNLPGWGPMREDDVSLADFLSDRGYTCGLVADTWHLFKPNMNFIRNFHTWEFVRGQEGDRWRTAPRARHDMRDHVLPHWYNDGQLETIGRQYLQNTDWFRSEEDYFCARTMRAALEWVENTRDRGPFFLYVDTFDPHEPFDPPRHYGDRHVDEYPCERPLYGYWIMQEDVREEDLPLIRGLYAANIELLDTWIGHLMDGLGRLGVLEDTLVCFTSDHGTEFFEHGGIRKDARYMYRAVTRQPLLVRRPDGRDAGRSVDALVSSVDIAPTLLRLMGETPPEAMTGLDVWPTVTGETPEIRDGLISAIERSANLRDHDWLYRTNVQPNAVHGKQHRQAKPSLYDLRADPGETTDVKDAHPDVAEAMRARLRRLWPDAL